MPNTLTWKRGLAEGTVIILSVLLALAADAWWDGRQASSLESQVLAEVAEEVAANRTRLALDVERISAMLDRIDRFQRSRPATLVTLPEDSVQPMLEGLFRPLTFEPQVSAAAVLSETALLSTDGIGVRALVSEFLARMADAEEEKEWFRDMSREVQSGVAGYLTQAPDGGRGILVERAARLGPSILAELRSDEDVMRHVVLRGAAGELYLQELTSLAGLLDSLEAQIGGSVGP
jgi:hypothetical protein